MKNNRRLADGSFAYLILKYLVRHPQAQDSIEGIVEWWLLEQRIVDAMAGVKAALAVLSAKMLVIPRYGLDGRTHYRLNLSKMEQIQAMLEKA